MRDNHLTWNDKKIYYKVYGSGRPVILLHGIPVDHTVWNDLATGLQKNYLVITPDTPGTGRSDMLDGDATIEDYADVIKAIIDKELSSAEYKKVCMIGHSMGGYIALAFAEKYPQYLYGLGLFHSTAFADDEEKKQTRLKAIEFIRSNGAYQFLKTSTPNLFMDKQHPVLNETLEKGKDFNSEALIQYYRAMIKRPDRTGVLIKTTPVLFIIGEKDGVIPLEAGLQQCHIPAVSHVHILDTAHMGMIEKNEASTRIIRSFLQNI
jgi:pimeloyl-ACP methyl ester carboxylesterase